MVRGLLQGFDECRLGFVGPSFPEESDSFAERRRLGLDGGQCRPTEEGDDKDQRPSSAKTALAIAWPLVPAAQPA